jgi:GT2 family glycosyltransferase
MTEGRERAIESRVGVVIATRDRAARLAGTLDRLLALPERPPIVLVDNSSSDRTPALVRARYPRVEVIELSHNHGAGARTLGIERLDVPYVAFSDDDSWWAPGALARAADLFDRHPRLGLISARILVGSAQRLDPTCAVMAASPLACDSDVPGRPILGFLACGALVRRRAYLNVGGFEPRLGVGGEEELFALDLASSGWDLAYVDDIVAHHDPVGPADPGGRRRRMTRNELLTTWLRRSPASVARHTARLLRAALTDPARARGVADAISGLPWALRHRRPVPTEVEASLRTVERGRH